MIKKIFFKTITLILIINSTYSQTYNPQRNTFFAANNYANIILAKHDFNGDGLDDLLVGGNNGIDLNKTPIYILISNGDGTFFESTSTYIQGQLNAAYPSSVNADYNNDGIMDFAIFDKGHMERGQDPVQTGFYGEDAQLLLSNPNGTWSISSVLADAHKNANHFGNSELHIKFCSAADVNNDGNIDIYVESGGGYNQLLTHIYNNNGDNTFTIGKLDEQIWSYPYRGPNWLWRQQANSFADVNNDGFPDLLIGQLRRRDNGQEDLTSFVLINDGKGNFLEEGAIKLSHPDWNLGYTYVRSILSLDLNNDGWMDLIFCQQRGQGTSEEFGGNYMQVYINEKGKGFSDKTLDYMNLTDDILSPFSDIYGTNQNTGAAILIDMNEDGFDDIFIANGPPVDKNNPLIYFNNGANYFIPASPEIYNSINDGQQWYGEDSYPIDLNGDGVMDIVSADLRAGPDNIYGTGDEFHELFPILGIRNYPKVSSISILNNEEFADGLNLIFIPDLGITDFYIETVFGGSLYTSDKQIIEPGTFVPRSVAELGFLFTPELDFKGNSFFYIQGATSTIISNLVGSKFISKIEVKCAGFEAPSLIDSIIYCENDEILPVVIDGSESNYIWYSDSLLTDVVFEGNSFVPNNIVGTTTYFVTQKRFLCESHPSSLTVIIKEQPQKPIISIEIAPITRLISSSPFGNQWFFDNNPIVGANNVDYFPDVLGEYSVEVTLNECKSTISESVLIEDLIITRLINDNNIVIWPNPVVSKLNVQFSQKKYTDYMVITPDGKTLLWGELNDSIDVSKLTNGLYILIMKNQNENIKLKIIKN